MKYYGVGFTVEFGGPRWHRFAIVKLYSESDPPAIPLTYRGRTCQDVIGQLREQPSTRYDFVYPCWDRVQWGEGADTL